MSNQQREKRFVAASSVVAAVFLTGTKLAVGLISGSLGILAEAAHSGLDLVAAGFTLFAVRASDRPADEAHMYGHGKIENLSALAETLLLFATCIWVIYEAVRRLLLFSVEVDASFWAFLIMAVSIVVDVSRSRALMRVAKKYNSQALEADALHFSTDVWSSLVVIAGLAMVRYGEATGRKSGFVRADAIAALVVAVIVMQVSVRLGRRTVDALLDRAPKGLAGRLSAAASQVAGVRRLSRMRVRNAGSQVFVDCTVEVPRHLSFEESHAVTREVQNAVQAVACGADVVVHTVPVAENEGLLETIQAVAAGEHLAVHNVTTHWTQRGIWVDLDLEVDPKLSFERAHALASSLAARLRSELPAGEFGTSIADIKVHIEPQPKEFAMGADIEPSEAARFVTRIEGIGRELGHARGCSDIELHKVKDKVYLSLQLQIDAARPIAEVHEIAEDMEARLRREFPQLGRIVIHTEPY